MSHAWARRRAQAMLAGHAHGHSLLYSRWTRGSSHRGARPRQARGSGSAGAPHRDRGQLHRRVRPHRTLPGDAPERPRARGGRNRHGARPRRARPQGRRARRLCLLRPGRLLRAAQCSGGARRESAARHLGRGGGGADAEGAHGAFSHPPHLQGRARRHPPGARCRRRRRPDPLPVGALARGQGDRRGRERRQGRARQEARLPARADIRTR